MSNNSFYPGMVVGIVIGMSLYAVSNYLQNKYGRVKKRIAGLKQEPKTGEFKMALLVRHDLKMGKGKVAAQCSHAIVHCIEECLRSYPAEINAWESSGKPIDVFNVDDEKSMFMYQQLAVQYGLNTYIVVDAGRTQVAPRSKTVMAIGPAKSEEINLITENLKTY